MSLPEEQVRRLRHDVSTPLTIITGFAEVLAAERPVSDAARRDYAARILAAGEELRTMIDRVLDEASD